MRRWWRVLLATVVITAGGGCGRTLMPTPNLIAAEEPNPFDAVPADRRSNVVEILYATDRQPTDEAGPGVTYGVLRSKSLAFGRTRVRIGPPDMGWDALVAASRAERRSRSLPVRYLDAEELVRLPKWPWYTNIGDDPTITEEQVRVLEDEAIADIHAHLTEILETTDRDEVFVFVHGFNNTFGYAAESLAQLWHFAGRPGIAILYSWPAARGGLFGYNPDRESSQFTVSHLKHFLAILAACDAVKRVDVISHSRGADVLGEALRELRIHYSAQGKDPAVELKIRHAVFAAADIDLEVSTMRLGGERVGDAAEHMTIYTGAGDAALRISANMFKSESRIGQIRPEDMSERQRITARMFADQFTTVYNPRKTGFLGHAYFLEDPAVTSDLLLLLRDDLRPGAEHGRPLVHDDSGMWVIPRGYPFPDADTQR